MPDQFQYVKLPDGSYGKFAANATDAQIRAAIAKDFPQAYQSQAPAQGQRFGQRFPRLAAAMDTAKDVGIGIAKGASNTGLGVRPVVQGLSTALNAIPLIGPHIVPNEGLTAMRGMSTPQLRQAVAPQGTAQKTGYYGEQAAEWLVPTGAEKAVAAKVATRVLPTASRVVPVAARVATAAAESGLRNKLQGGDFSTGATTGAIGSGAGQLFEAAAPKVAEIAMRPGKRLLKSIPQGVNIGETVLRDSTGVQPATIASQLSAKIADESNAKNAALVNAGRRGVRVPLDSARQVVTDEMGRPTGALAQNSPNYIKDVAKVGDQLKYQYGEDGQPLMQIASPTSKPGAGFIPVQLPTAPQRTPILLPPEVDPVRAHAIVQGIDKSIGNWNPEAQSAIAPLQERVRGVIASRVHDLVPETAPLDQQMTSQIAARDAAHNVAYDPGIAKSIVNRFARPTGALAGGLLGGEEGYKRDGVQGAVIGGTIGVALPELVASPTGQMTVARTLASPTPINLAKGLGVQIARPSSLDDDEPTE